MEKSCVDTKELICIGCPLGCNLTAYISGELKKEPGLIEDEMETVDNTKNYTKGNSKNNKNNTKNNMKDETKDNIKDKNIEALAEKYIEVKGNTCPRGAAYARKELTNPTRIVTSSVRVLGGDLMQVSCKTKSDIPKSKIMDCMKELSKLTVCAPVHIGDVLLENVAGTCVDIVATKEIMVK